MPERADRRLAHGCPGNLLCDSAVAYDACVAPLLRFRGASKPLIRLRGPSPKSEDESSLLAVKKAAFLVQSAGDPLPSPLPDVVPGVREREPFRRGTFLYPRQWAPPSEFPWGPGSCRRHRAGTPASFAMHDANPSGYDKWQLTPRTPMGIGDKVRRGGLGPRMRQSEGMGQP